MVSDVHTASSDAGPDSAKTMPEPTAASPTSTNHPVSRSQVPSAEPPWRLGAGSRAADRSRAPLVWVVTSPTFLDQKK